MENLDKSNFNKCHYNTDYKCNKTTYSANTYAFTYVNTFSASY